MKMKYYSIDLSRNYSPRKIVNVSTTFYYDSNVFWCFFRGFRGILHHFCIKTQLRLRSNKIYINTENLEEWLNYHVFSTEFNHKTDAGSAIIKINIPKIKKIQLDDFLMSVFYQSKYGSGSYTESITKIKAWIIVEFKVKKQLKEIWNYIQKIIDLLALGIGTRPALLNLEGDNDQEAGQDISIYYYIFHNKKQGRVLPYFMPFTFTDISVNKGQNLKLWFKNNEVIKPTYDLFFTSFDNPYIHPIFEFLSLVQALESYHDRKNPKSEVIPKEEYKIIETELKNGIEKSTSNEKYREHLLNQIKYINTKRLRMRLSEIYKDNIEIYNHFITDEDKFINEVVTTRNYYTHYDINQENKIIKEKDLPIYSQKLKWIIIVILIKEIGLTNEMTKKIIDSYQKYHSITQVIE